jgi:hypothetical protein
MADLDFSKGAPMRKVNWENVIRNCGDSFMFCAEDAPNEIAKLKEREANKKEKSFASRILEETILSSNVDLEATLSEFQATRLEIAPKLRSTVESFVEAIDRKASKIVPPPHSARTLVSY